MAALEEGCQYGLSSNFSSFSNKSVVHVKLTDTSLKTIEDYIRNKSQYGQRPSIQFLGNNGTVEIPVRVGTSSEMRPFQFTMSAIQGDPNGSFDCVQQPNTKHGNQLCLEGRMDNKISIHATNEIFKATKDRVTQAELDSKKASTKVIKQSGPRISHKRTVVLKKTHQHHQQQQPPHSTQVKQPTPAIAVKPKPTSATPVTFNQRPSPSSSSSHGNASSPHSAMRESSAVVSSSVPKPSSPSLSSSSTTSSSTKPSTNSAVMSMPYRDRVIHLLAIRPYKKPELLLRLRRDGIRDKDKDSLGTILNQVAIIKDNKFSLAKHAFVDVRLEWPFYTEDDRKILKKKLQSASSPASSPAAPSQSPDSATSSQQPVPQKRPIEEPTATHTAKKQRISHYEKYKKENKPFHSIPESDKRDVSSTAPGSDKSHRKENIHETSLNAASSTVETPSYIEKYRLIQSPDQRQLYKRKFNEEYEEYRELHSNVEKVSRKFAELEVLMKQTPEGSDEYENLKNKIRKEYRLQKSDPKYIEQKKRFEFLHGKLAHIKKLILDFDQMQTAVDS